MRKYCNSKSWFSLQESKLREQYRPFSNEGKTSRITLKGMYINESNDDRWLETQDDIGMYIA